VAEAKAQPALLALAAEQPDIQVRVIAQMAGDSGDAEALVSRLGGTMIRDLGIINAFAAYMEASAARKMAGSPDIRWISLDVPALSASAVADFTVRDEFSAYSYGGNDGSRNWSSAWREVGEWSDPDDGYIRIKSDSACASGRCLRLENRRGDRGIYRKVDLSGASSATLTFDYGHNFYGGRVEVQVSSDGGDDWTTLESYAMYQEQYGKNASFDLMPFAAADTRIRFMTLDSGWGRFWVDNVQIGYSEGSDTSCSACQPNLFLDTANVRPVWDMGLQGQGITVAVIDSGVAPDPDFGAVVESRAFGSSTGDDPSGHGTHVAGIIAGNGTDSAGYYKGIAPQANLIGIAISDETGMAYESDVVAALQWVYDNKDVYNIRLVNLSFNSAAEESYHNSPMDAAAEILWFNGVVVVASAGNKGVSEGPNPADAAPANDPFIITVGASNEQGTADRDDDSVASFSANATTMDGFQKPELLAPGKDIFSVLSAQSTWKTLYPERSILDGQYFRLSGTSMAAPMVSGAVALLLQDEPNLTPDQVKYRLLNSGPTLGSDLRQAYPYLDVYAAVTATSTESANTGIQASQLLWTGSDPITWNSVSWNSVSWNSVSWNSVSWNSVSWNSVSWNSTFWDE
jgi:serine protease AprX